MRLISAIFIAAAALQLAACAETDAGYQRGINTDVGATLGRKPGSLHPGSRQYLMPPSPEQAAPDGASGER